MPGFFANRTATIYSRPAGPRGTFSVVARADLACRLDHLSLQPAATGPERVELAERRNFKFDPTYYLPEDCQIAIDGIRWNPVKGTIAKFLGPDNRTPVYGKADVVRAASG